MIDSWALLVIEKVGVYDVSSIWPWISSGVVVLVEDYNCLPIDVYIKKFSPVNS